ncbi:MAG TPA: NUDIX hydrolase [Bacteroidales bacterium]|nr:MAG: hypothetical protein A2X11_04255 [Bacteroidetes bacterium GWE2_42_24]OFY25257.1 MAG: hypothetical protein A2X09_11040 [Bacteroidetes bacterium GWF2_43_11]PKP16997.1 MAG: NUDIX hydrolase [Bacteroidetes bacterium HGW-Bacteroidetes-22]HAQ65944.1 NUDIX hydrolase [Bacteroidales bacterium]HBZ66960.1 NUDIX hydrolase [Bacteroidales bacterium]
MSYTYQYPRPCVTVDIILFRKKEGPTEVLLIQRDRDPFAGSWAFPGGFVNIDEELEAAAYRELLEETGLTNVKLQQWRTFGAVNRDPRHRTITVAYKGWAVGSEVDQPVAGDDARSVKWWRVDQLSQLAFDHTIILTEALQACNEC